MSDEVIFGLVVSVEQDGTLTKIRERCESKYAAAEAAQTMAEETPGMLFVAMECYEAYRAVAKCQRVYLGYPTQPAVRALPASAEDEIPI